MLTAGVVRESVYVRFLKLDALLFFFISTQVLLVEVISVDKLLCHA